MYMSFVFNYITYVINLVYILYVMIFVINVQSICAKFCYLCINNTSLIRPSTYGIYVIILCHLFTYFTHSNNARMYRLCIILNNM